MYNQEQAVVISWNDYHNGAKQRLMEECCLSDEAIEATKAAGTPITIHLRTTGQENIIGAYPGYNRLYKHIFLQNPAIKREIIDYYRAKGFHWVDIVPLNRTHWKIFLFYQDQIPNGRLPHQPRKFSHQTHQTHQPTFTPQDGATPGEQ